MRTTRILCLACIALLCCSCMMPDRDKQVAANELKLAEEGYDALEPGEPAPDVQVSAINGADVIADPLNPEQPVLLFFVTDVRTPNSATQVHKLNRTAPELSAAGVLAAIVLPVGKSAAADYGAEHCPELLVVADPDLQVSIAYGCAVEGVEYLQRTQVGVAADGSIAFFERGFPFTSARAVLDAFGLQESE